MNQKDFTFEFHSEMAQPDDQLRVDAERELRSLTRGHSDLIGASVAVEELTGAETPFCYEARVMIYARPENIVAVDKGADAQTALSNALSAAERQMRETRERLREQRRQP